MLTLLAASAYALEANPQLLVDLSLVVGSDPAHRFGAELGATWLVAIADCTACGGRTGFPDSLWPVFGPRASIAWRGDTRFVGELSAQAGIASIEPHDTGFLPYWQALGRAGVALDGETVGFRVGGELAKSFSTRFVAGTDGDGTDLAGLRLEVGQLTKSGSEVLYSIGAQVAATPTSDLVATATP
jgi:hypothetical protein